MRLRYNIKPCRPMCILEREREHIGSICSRNTCLDSPLTAAQNLLLEGLDDLRNSQRLNNNDRKQALQRIIKTVYKQYLNTKQIVLKYSTRRYELVSERITQIGATV
jgi:recombinational DNA repair protein (RecF pathway)